jgi:hypothetical protein
MARATANTKARKERGMALLLTLFALLLLSAIGLFMVLSSTTETRIDTNYGTGLRAYYSARSGLEEARDRIKYPSASGGLADKLPQDIAGNAHGVLYVLNPAGGETVDPTDPTSPYFDDELCHDYNSGTPKDIKCTVVPVVPNWQMAPQFSLAPASGQMGYKWIRINMKTNRIADPYFVDQNLSGMPADTRICWDGQTEQLSPGGANPSCDANGMQTVYMVTALAATPQARGLNGARKLLRTEIVGPSIRPPGAITLGASNTAPVLTTGAGVPAVVVDGRVHRLDGTPATGNSCSAVAPLGVDGSVASDGSTGASQLQTALYQLRLNIVQTANASCKADGSNQNGNICTSGLWWVRGTDSSPRFTTTSSSGTSGSTSGSSGGGTYSSGPSASSTSGLSGGGTSGGSGSGHDDHGGGTSGSLCDSTTSNCFTGLDLSAPQLFATAATWAPHVPLVTLPANPLVLYAGNPGNQSDAAVYQTGLKQGVQNEIAAVNTLVSNSLNKPNYFSVSSTTLATSYGTSTDPAVVVFTDQTLSLQNNATLTGFGVLVVSNALEISNATLNWTGIVLVASPTGHVTIGQGATGYINGGLLLQPGAALSFQNATSPSVSPFMLTYSCEAIDLPFGAQPFKVISTAESSF